ncbi:S1C family serine protease [Macrococcus armenti]|uniref:S1C family serine protease n=1 Tax=Macrococcus armenti TaxID=2875764 RepID=UPI001CD24542|nr:S1C family serine protease [Macrococcus armenti]UBH11620.1 S1C family serine protease [Macrococcus armenti]
MKKITIKRKNYKRPKRLFYDEQEKRHIFPYLHKKDATKHIIKPEESRDDLLETEQYIVDSDVHENEETHVHQETPHDNSRDMPQETESEEHIDEAVHDTNHEQEINSDVAPVQEIEIPQETIEERSETNAFTPHYIEDEPSERTIKWLIPLMSGILIGILLATLLLPSMFKEKQQEVTELSPSEIIKQNKATVVTVTNIQKASNEPIDAEASEKAPEETGIGSGVIYNIDDKYAYIITNYHVVGKAPEIEVTQGKLKEKATLVGKDIWTDTAVIKIPKGNLKKTVKFGDSNKLEAGEPVLALGSPLGKIFAGSATSGIISGLNRTVPVDVDGDNQYDWSMEVFQTDAAINPGNSGGALFNNKGEMIGLNSLKITMDGVEGIAFSIPSNDVKKDIKILERDGEIKRPKLGISVEDLSQSGYTGNLKDGVQVMKVDAESIAANAGITEGDVITQIDDIKITDKVQFRKVLFKDKNIGDTITIKVESQGAMKSVKLTLK